MNFLSVCREISTCITNHRDDIKAFLIIRFDNDGKILNKVKVSNDHTIALYELIDLPIDVLCYPDWELYISYKNNDNDEDEDEE